MGRFVAALISRYVVRETATSQNFPSLASTQEELIKCMSMVRPRLNSTSEVTVIWRYIMWIIDGEVP